MDALPRYRRAMVGVAALVTLASAVLVAVAPATASPQAMLVSPVDGVRVVRLFDRPPEPWHAGHRGIDLAAAEGAPVVSPGDGMVTFAGEVVDRGVVTIAHPSGVRSSLEPVAVAVEVGERVVAGQAVGIVENSGGHCGGRECVHWGVREGDRYLNPLDWLVGFGPVRLLPMEHGRS